MTKSTYLKSSPYYKTEQVNKYLDYLGFWSGVNIPASNDDMLMILEAKYTKRPDLLSFDMYQTPQLWWAFILRNPDVIRDPINDFLPGIAIYVPSKELIQRYT